MVNLDNFLPKDLIPLNVFRAFTPETIDDLLAVGSLNLRVFKRGFRREETRLTRELEKAEEKLKPGIENDLRKINDKISILTSLEKQAEDKPLFPAYRTPHYVQVANPAVVFIGQWNWPHCNKIVKEDWASGHIDMNHWMRGDEPHFTVSCNVPVHNGSFYDGKGLSMGIQDPRLLRLRDFIYLARREEGVDLNFVELWCNHTACSLPVPEVMRASLVSKIVVRAR